MELREGYKQTEVGLIPEDWNVKELQSIGSFKKGTSIPKKDLTDEGLPCVLYGEIYTRYNFVARELFSRIPAQVATKATPIEKGDILFAGSGETAEDIGKCFAYMGNDKAYAGGDLIILSPYSDDSALLGYLLNAPIISKQKAQLAQGSSVFHLYSANLKSVLIPLSPSQEEQNAIATALSDIDALITSLDALIAKKRAIKQGAMQELLTGKKRLPGFEEEWEEKSIGEITDVISGGTPSTLVEDYWGGNIRWMNSGELNLKRVYEVEGRITESGLQNSSTSLLPTRCVLIGLAGQGKTRGTVAMNMVELCINQSIAAIIPNDSFIPDFLYHNLDGRYQELRQSSTGEGGRGALNLGIVKSLLVHLPDLQEQHAIADILTDMDNEIASLEQRRAKYQLVKQGMMQDLLTGKKRLV